MLGSLRARLFASYLALVVVILAAAALTLAVIAQGVQGDIVRARLEGSVPVTARLVRELAAQDMTPADIAAELASEDPERPRVLLVRRGVVVGDTSAELAGQRLDLPQPLRRPQGNPVRPLSGVLETPGGRTFYYALDTSLPPAAQNAGPPRPEPLLVVMVAPRRPLLALADIARPLAWAGVIALILGFVLALWISRSIARPLRRIAAATQQVAAGDLDLDLPAEGPREIVQLAAQFERMASEVKASRQAQRDFIANVSHDLKTPLTGIRGFSQAIIEGVAGDPQRLQRAAQVIHEEALRMGRLVDQLLDLARLDAGQAPLQLVPLDVRALLGRVIGQMAPQASQKGVSLRAEGGEPLWIEGDGDRLIQVFTNLVDNAINHTPPGGSVHCTANAEAPGWVEIEIRDSGEGIPAEDLPHIFDRFYQADKARGGGKTGLGLAIVQEIVRAHGGEVGVDSAAGEGARFWLRLPRPNN